jgi:hypothetical protein
VDTGPCGADTEDAVLIFVVKGDTIWEEKTPFLRGFTLGYGLVLNVVSNDVD